MQADKAQKATGSQDVRTLIQSSPEHAVGALLKIYSFQTGDEQASNSTVQQNDCGFNMLDAGPMSSIAKWYIEKGWISDRQIAFVQKVMPKYIRQLEVAGFEPVAISPPPTKEVPAITSNMQAGIVKDELVIKFNFPRGDNRFGEVLAKVKTLSGRRFDSVQKCWTAPLAYGNVTLLKEWGFDFSEALTACLEKEKNPAPKEEFDFSILDSRLFPYQKEGVAFIDAHNGRALIGDDMGLGKTCQALSWLRLHPEKRPAVVVCPASLKYNWEREVRMWISEQEPVQIINGKKGGKVTKKGIIIINYDILNAWLEQIIEVKPQIVIFDECHYNKNSQSIRTKASKKLAKACPHVICMSGTPIKSKPIEFFNTINMINPKLFGSYWKFAHEYTNASHNGFGWSFNGARNTEKLHKILTETIMIRRRKEDVLTQLPPKRRAIVPMEIVNKKDYSRAAVDIIGWVLDNQGRAAAEKAKQAEVLVAFEKLKQLAVDGIIDQTIEWIRDFLESGEKLIVFGVHKRVLDALQSAFPDCSVRVDGGTSQINRQKAVDAFQTDDKVKLFLGNVIAAGVGLTLTAASNVAFIELPWTPGELVQAEDRAHRIGQDANVVIWYLIAAGTIMEEIAQLLDNKAKVLSAVLDGQSVEENNILTELIQNLKEREN